MRKIILDLAVSLDGFIEGPSGETDWCLMDPEMGFERFLASIDTIFYGRVSYDQWGNFQSDDPLWTAIHAKKKYVFSTAPRQDCRATFITGSIAEEVKAIRNQPGRDIWLYGGAKLISTFIALGLVDVYRISVHPVVLGNGKPLFENVRERINLKLTGVNRFQCGVVQLIYEPIFNRR